MKTIAKFFKGKKAPRRMTVWQLLDANLAAGRLLYVWEVRP